MNPIYDPYTQSFLLRHADGTPFTSSLVGVDDGLQYAVLLCINYASQLGASIVLLVILLLLTRPEKRRSLVFCLNCSALLFNIARLVCEIKYFTSPFFSAYAILSKDLSDVPLSSYVGQVLGTVFTTLVLICVEISLVLQVHVVCANLPHRYRHILLCVSTLVALIPIGFRMGYMIRNCTNIIQGVSSLPIKWLESIQDITETMSICFFCAVFVTKLGFAIKLRRRLGFRDFDPMKVIFVMGCQTMIVPALFAILQYCVLAPEISSNVFTLVTISLPLSSIWAGATFDHPNNTPGIASSRTNMWHNLTHPLPGNLMKSQPTVSVTSPSATQNTTCYADQSSSTRLHDLESKCGISVEHDISIHSFKRDGYSNV